MDKLEIAGLFGIGEVASLESIDRGHINSTFLVQCRDDERYVLQSLSREVFRSPEAVMGNIAKITSVYEASAEMGIRIPQYLCNAGGNNFVNDDGTTYRLYRYTEPSCVSGDSFRRMGHAFGAYIRMLSGKKVKLEDTIPDFHCFSEYFTSLTGVLNSSPLKKIDNFVVRRLSSVLDTVSQVFTVDFPKRNVHNDAKRDNIILGDVCTVIDLDTTMKGYAAIDYGDMIRSVCDGDRLNYTVIKTVTDGFAEGLDGILTDDEIYSLYYGILYVTGELAVRYLIDYMSEEKYFKGKTSGECLSRANSLLHRLNMFISEGEELTAIIYKAFGKR